MGETTKMQSCPRMTQTSTSEIIVHNVNTTIVASVNTEKVAGKSTSRKYVMFQTVTKNVWKDTQNNANSRQDANSANKINICAFSHVSLAHDDGKVESELKVLSDENAKLKTEIAEIKR